MQNKPIFKPSFGNRPDQLIGRDAIIENIMDGLNAYSGSSERATLILGQRGMGKTALLLEIADKATQFDYIPVRVTCGDSMLDNIIELLQRSGSSFINEAKSTIKGFSAGALGFSFGLTFTEEAQRSFGFRVKLEMICDKLSRFGKQVLILVDEADPSIEPMRELARTYQELAGEEKNLAIVMAGLPSAISNMLTQKTLTFLNRAQRITLDLIPIHEIEAYYSTAFQRASISADSATTKRAAEATQGFPYLIQLVGYYLSKLSESGKKIDKKYLQQAIDSAYIELDNKVFQAMLNELSNLDITILKEIAKDGGTSKTSTLESTLGLSHGTMQTYRKRLLDSGVVFSPRRGELSLVMPQLGDYLLRLDE